MGSGLSANHVKNIKTSQIKAECNVLDYALETWSAAHRQIKENTVNFTGQDVFYEQKRTYPLAKADLLDLQAKGYFAKTIDLEKYRYETKNDGADYSLEVALPDGSLYKSPKSTY